MPANGLRLQGEGAGTHWPSLLTQEEEERNADRQAKEKAANRQKDHRIVTREISRALEDEGQDHYRTKSHCPQDLRHRPGPGHRVWKDLNPHQGIISTFPRRS